MLPVALFFSAHNLSADPASLVSWLLLWPKESLFPFPIGQIWFVNALMMMVLFSIPVFMILRRFRQEWVAAGLAGYLLLTLIFDSATVISVFNKSSILEALRLPFQLYQALMFAQFYFLGAVGYKNPNRVPRPFLIGLCLLTLLPGLYLSCAGIEKDIRPGSANYILLAYAAIFALLLGRDTILRLFNRVVLLKKLLLFAGRNSYGIFLLHIPVLFVIEKSFGLENLSGNLPLALVRLVLVIAVTMLICVPFTMLYQSITKRVSKMWPGA